MSRRPRVRYRVASIGSPMEKPAARLGPMNPTDKMNDALRVGAEPTQGRCASCRWWRVDEEDAYEVRQFGVRDPLTYELVEPQPFEIRKCYSPELKFYERPGPGGAVVMDGSQYMAILVTGHQFGCVNWTPHEQGPLS